MCGDEESYSVLGMTVTRGGGEEKSPAVCTGVAGAI
jgi:hypothetical protein